MYKLLLAAVVGIPAVKRVQGSSTFHACKCCDCLGSSEKEPSVSLVATVRVHDSENLQFNIQWQL